MSSPPPPDPAPEGSDPEPDAPDLREILVGARCAFAIALAEEGHPPAGDIAGAAADEALGGVDCLRIAGEEMEVLVEEVDLGEASPEEAAYEACRTLIVNDLLDGIAPPIARLLERGTGALGAVVEAMVASPAVTTLRDVADDDRVGQLALDDLLLASAFPAAMATLVRTAVDGDDSDKAVVAVVNAVLEEYADDPQGVIDALLRLPVGGDERVGDARSVLEVATHAVGAWLHTTLTQLVLESA